MQPTDSDTLPDSATSNTASTGLAGNDGGTDRGGSAGITPGITPGSERDGLREAIAMLDAADCHQKPIEMSLALAQVGRCYRKLGALAEARWYLQQSLRWARSLGGVDLTVDILCDLAEVAAWLAASADEDDPRAVHAARERARDHAYEASHLAGRAADPEWEVTVLLRVSDVLDDCGDHDDAIAMQCRALQLIAAASARHGLPVQSALPAAMM